MPTAPPTPGMPRPGDSIAGRYRVDHVIGSGGMGCVLAAEHLLLRTRVAIKLLLPQAAAWPGATERFLREAQAAATLRGEHVARVIDMGTIESGAPFMVMEFLHGRDLQKVIRERAPLSVHEAVDYLLQICDAIQEAHAIGILHRDLKPANIFVTTRPNGTPLLKVLDFGLAKVRAQSDSTSPEAGITQTGQILGSPHYMPPEQFRGLRHADARSDIWALGVVLYELLTGRRPFVGEGAGGVMASIFSDDPPPLAFLRPDIPTALAEVVMACLAKRPDNRPQQVAALIAALEPFAAKAERASLAWIDPPADSLSLSAPISHGASPPRGSGTVRIGVPPTSPRFPAPPIGLSSAIVAPAPSFAETADEAPAQTAPSTSASTSAYMGISTPIVSQGDSVSSSRALPMGETADMSPPAGPSGSPRAAPAHRLTWIVAASIASAVMVVGVIARAVITSEPGEGSAAGSDGATTSLAPATPIVSVSPALTAALSTSTDTPLLAPPVSSSGATSTVTGAPASAIASGTPSTPVSATASPAASDVPVSALTASVLPRPKSTALPPAPTMGAKTPPKPGRTRDDILRQY